MEYRFLDPVDVLFLRGNKLFGDPGSHGEALVPPWPSVAAGALRSRMLVDADIDLAAFADGQTSHPELGTPAKPGTFAIAGFYLARRRQDDYEILMPPPSDLVISKRENDPSELEIRLLQPQPLHTGLQCSGDLPLTSVLAQGDKRSKPVGGYWLSQRGWQQYLNGEAPDAAEFTPSSDLWQLDERVGIGLNADTGSMADGRLFTVQAVAFTEGVGFIAAVQGATPPQNGLLRFGGDGRAVEVSTIDLQPPQADYQKIINSERCRLVLTTPGLFADGWLPNGVQRSGEEYVFDLHGARGRLVAAALSRADVISGWDLAQWQPKPAQRAVPSGSVFWLEDVEATSESLDKLVNQGLWSEKCKDPQRRAEGFNRLTLAPWAERKTND